MDYKAFKAPYISNVDINKEADKFRKKFWGDIIPVNIEYILEEKLSIEIIPLPGLKQWCNTDAFISLNWQSVYIDNKKYMDDSYYNRLRFSIAHEVGHMVLHKDLYNRLNIKTHEDFSRFLFEVPGKQYGYLETQANKFAGYFLIPRDILYFERNKAIDKHQEIINFDSKQVNGYLALPLSKKFGVSAEAMEIALVSGLDSEWSEAPAGGPNVTEKRVRGAQANS